MTITFFKFLPKNIQTRLFESGIFFCFAWNFAFSFESADFKQDNSFLKLQPKNMPIRQYLSKISGCEYLQGTLHFVKIKGPCVKFENSFFQPKDVQVSYFWS